MDFFGDIPRSHKPSQLGMTVASQQLDGVGRHSEGGRICVHGTMMRKIQGRKISH